MHRSSRQLYQVALLLRVSSRRSVKRSQQLAHHQLQRQGRYQPALGHCRLWSCQLLSPTRPAKLAGQRQQHSFRCHLFRQPQQWHLPRYLRRHFRQQQWQRQLPRQQRRQQP
jgi:hypothetical protein